MMEKTERPLPIPVTMENLWLHCGHGTRRHYTDEGRCLPMRRLTAAEFDRIATAHGYVKRPVCGECGGSGECPNPIHEREKRMNPMHSPGMANPHLAFACVGHCPSCGGTGFGRLVALDALNALAYRMDLEQELGDLLDALDGGQI